MRFVRTNRAEAGINDANVALSATETITSNERVLGADPLVDLVPACGTEGEEGYIPEVPGGIGEEDITDAGSAVRYVCPRWRA